MRKYENNRQKNTWIVVGLMSGTSVDGLDICATRFRKENNCWHYEILKAESYDYPHTLKEGLINCISFRGEELIALDQAFGSFMAQRVNDFLKKEKFIPDLIASHGHTVFHQPENGMTCQIGDGQNLHHGTGITVINDFRKLDVLKGGQGAPLVPIGDELLFPDYDVCLNIGGFANMSFRRKDGVRMAFDIGPANIVLNKYARQIGMDYDMNGDLARNGKIVESLLEKLNRLPFYTLQPPKSLGLEWVILNIFNLIDQESPKVQDILRTVTEHIAIQINLAISQHVYSEKSQVLSTGGGVKNSFLMDRIRSNAKKLEYVVPGSNLVDFKEAMIFGLMGLLRYLGEINTLASVTGAESDSSSGVIHD